MVERGADLNLNRRPSVEAVEAVLHEAASADTEGESRQSFDKSGRGVTEFLLAGIRGQMADRRIAGTPTPRVQSRRRLIAPS